MNAIRQDTQTKGLLFAGTELGIYVSFDDGDHWQSLQLNLPVSSVRDITIHGDDLAVATHGRSFWILDNITPLRQMSRETRDASALLFQPATAVRIDNDVFLGSPLPPEEPAAKNPPDGAMIDYYLKSPAKEVKLEIFDSNNKLVRRFSSGQKTEAKDPPLPIAERWLPKPVVLESSPGMHRFVWDLRWSSSGTGEEEEDEGFGAPRGPKIAPGTYQLKLIVDGQIFMQNFKVEMDPRSQATQAELDEQQRLGLEIFGEVRHARRALAEIGAVKKQLSEAKSQLRKEPRSADSGDERRDCDHGHRKGKPSSKSNHGSGDREHRIGIGAACGGRRRSHRAITGHRALSPVRRSGESGDGRVDEAEEHSVG